MDLRLEVDSAGELLAFAVVFEASVRGRNAGFGFCSAGEVEEGRPNPKERRSREKPRFA